MMPSMEVHRVSEETPRVKGVMQALLNQAPGAPHGCVYRGHADWLLMWGPGEPVRAALMQKHVAQGKHVIAFDLAYWQRETKFRVSIDAAHPQAWVMRRDWPAYRFKNDQVPVADLWRPNGPILVAGIGPKARVQYGDAVTQWETEQVARCRARWPDRQILYRLKPPHGGPVPHGAELLSGGTIDQAFRRHLSLVITWHSNVAVDAIRMGVPVMCRDGAAAAVCPAALGPDDPQPLSPELRDRFLQNLAWFQWAPREMSACLTFLRELLA